MTTDDPTSAKGLRIPRGTRRARRRRRIVLCLAGVAVIGAFVLAARPVYHWAKARRADQLASAAAELVAAGKLNEAAGKYRAALQLDPLGYRPLEGAAKLATQGNRPEALDLWEQVIRLPMCTTADRQDYAALLLEKGKVVAAEKVIAGLLTSAPDSRTLSLAANFAVRNDDLPRAIQFARLASARLPDDDRLKLQLADLLAKSSETPQRTEARDILWSLAGRAGALQNTAVEGLARSPDLSPEEKQRVIGMLKPTTVTQSLLAAELELQFHPDQSAAIFDREIARWASHQKLADTVEVARWLSAHGQAERTLQLLPFNVAMSNEAALVTRLDALASSEKWDEIERNLRQPDLPIDTVVIEAFSARSALGHSAPLYADLHWDRAIAAAGTDPMRLRFVARFAEASRAFDVALKAYDQLARLPDDAAFAQAGRQRILLQLGAVSGARTAAEQLAALSPDDPNAQAQLAYLNLLAHVDVSQNAEKAKALALKYPERLAYRVAAALGCLRENDPKGARAQFAGPPIEWQRTPARWRAVYAAVLFADGDGSGARAILANVQPNDLTEEERKLIAGIPPQP